ncbi:MAG TPA: hypothetical protein VJ898_15200 [Natrialbaceae archaeon]|nr:hypothetical protein [Natrialbaceae archaeon]
MNPTMKTTTETELHRRSMALRFGHPTTDTTTMATLAYVALLTLGTMLVVAGTMSVSELSAGTGALVAASAVVLGATLGVLRPRLRGAF